MTKLNLKTITCVLVDGVDPNQSAKTLNYCASLCDFYDVKLISFKKPDIKYDYSYIEIPKLDYKGYNEFIVKKLNNYIDSEYALVIQTDGFIVNLYAWKDEYLKYDYIGAPWFSNTLGDSRVGNGGFSLRSKRFIERCAQDDIDMGHPAEDAIVCSLNKSKIENSGLKYAPIELAAFFSFSGRINEVKRSWQECFGAHIPPENSQYLMDEYKEASKNFHNLINLPSLQEIYNRYNTPEGDGDKGTCHSYLNEYDKILRYKRQNVNILEIGVSQGYSMMLWKDYFKDSNIIGLDIDLSYMRFPKEGFNVYQINATDENSLNNTLKDLTFDYIIDDGSHFIQDQLKSFEILYPRVKEGGYYFIEDIMDLENNYGRIKALNPNINILDFRRLKNRYDDVLAICKK